MSTATIESHSASRAESQLVTFLLDEEEFGFDIMNVQEIIRVPKVSRVPRTPDYVEGIANLRGIVLPIVDTRARFGMKRVEDTDRTRVLVIDNNGVRTGLRVDRVRQVTRVSNSDIEHPPTIIKGINADYLSGVVKLDKGKRIVMALNPAKVCQVNLRQQTVEQTQTVAHSSELAIHKAGQGSQDIEQMVTFKLGSEEFAFRIERIREILRVEEPKEVPDTPKYVLGVLTVRGQILPIIDLRCLLQQKSLAEELCARFEREHLSYSRSLETLSDSVAKRNDVLLDIAFFEAAKEQFNAFNSSSQALMESIARLRSDNDKAHRQAQAALKLRRASPQESHRLMEQEVIPLAGKVANNFAKLEELIHQNIKEDQRIVVVDAKGTLLGLVVDHVNEVLNVPKNLIDPPPQMGSGSSVEMSGIAKLENGARLIMLLDSDKLFQDENLKDLRQSTAVGSETSTTMNHEATDKKARSAVGEQQLVTFKLGNEEFGIPISQIQEIDRYSQVTRVPRAPEFVLGVTNLRGEVIPVIDTRRRFGIEVKQPDDRTRIIMVELAGTKTGLLVDSVSQVLNIAAQDIAPPPSAIESGIDNEFISGIGKVDNGKRMVVLLNVEKILTRKEHGSLVEMTARQ